MIFLILEPTFWLIKSLLAYFLIVISITTACRAYKIIHGRKNKRPVDGRDAVFVTGATSGIGLAVSKHLYKLGYSVFVGYFNSSEPGYAELLQIKKEREGIEKNYTNNIHQQRMIFIELDVRDQQSISRAYLECNEALEDNKLRLYALINNAGLGSLQPFAWLQRHKIVGLIETNLLGTLLMTREFLPLIVSSKGRILNVSSGLGLVPGETYTTYGITKLAQIYFTRCMNKELSSRYRVKSIAVMPHNYIKNTNICAHNVKTNESAWSELKQLERQLYEVEFEEHQKKAKQLEEATKTHAKLANQQHNHKLQQNQRTGTYSSKREPEEEYKWIILSKLRVIFKCLMDVIERLKGDNAALTLEDSGVLDCFEDALRLNDPPEHIFAGDNIYNLLIGSLLLSMPSSCMNLLGSLVSPSLYK